MFQKAVLPRDWIVIGCVNSPYGIRGEVKIFSYTTPPENLLKYQPWHFRQGNSVFPLEVLSARYTGKKLLARFKGYETPEAVRTFQGAEIVIERTQLPVLPPDEYYWIDLIGLSVLTIDGHDLGKITSLFEIGSNDVLVVKGDRERLIPYVPQCIKNIDKEKKIILVDWDPEI